jgi:hypothetical protein
MSLFDDASLIITPNAYKAGKLYAIKPTSGAGDLDVVRATSATRVNSAGLIEVVGNNVPRLDYPPLGGCPSILVEPQRTNLVFPSAVATTQTRTVAAVAHTLSFYGTGSVTLSGVATGTLNGTGANNRVTLTFTPTAGSLTLTVSGSVTDWQLEAGANATSVIPTVASAVTRNADVISKTGISSLIGQTEGTIFVDVNLPSSTESVRHLQISDGTNGNRIQLASLGSNLTPAVVFGGAVQASFSIPFTSGINKIAIAYKLNDIVFYRNGLIVGTDTSASIPTCSKLDLGTSGGDNFLNSTINLAAIFPTRLTNAQLAQLTTL